MNADEIEAERRLRAAAKAVGEAVADHEGPAWAMQPVHVWPAVKLVPQNAARPNVGRGAIASAAAVAAILIASIIAIAVVAGGHTPSKVQPGGQLPSESTHSTVGPATTAPPAHWPTVLRSPTGRTP